MALLDLMGLGADKQAVIIDIGTAFTKIGLAGEQAPRHILPTELRRIEKGQLVSTPILRTGELNNVKQDEEELFSLFKDFFHEIYFKYLLVNPKERRVVVCDSMLKPIHVRNVMARVLCKYFEVVSIVFIPSHLLALFACGMHTGLVVDSGCVETVVAPIYEQNTILNGLEFIDLAGDAIHEEIRKRIEHSGVIKVKNEEQPAKSHLRDITPRVLEDIKVRCCFVGHRDCDKNAVPVNYPLGGDKILTIDGALRAHSMDIQFQGDDEGRSIATTILDSLLKCPLDCRKTLAENILLIGGTVMSPGFESRLMAELKFLLKSDEYNKKLFLKKIAFRKPPISHIYCAWQGGAILGALEILPELSISRERYHADPTIPDWSSVLNVEKEETTKSLLDDKYKWKSFRKSLSATSATAPSTGPQSTATTLPVSGAVTTTQSPGLSVSQSATSVSERIRQELGLTK